MSIVTKNGDRGKTKLYSGEEVSKADARLETYGTLDELVSQMGFARSLCQDREVSDLVLRTQETLFRLGSELAVRSASAIKLNPISAKDVEKVDNLILDIESKLPLPKHFIIPGDNTVSAAFDVCRTVCRRFERLLVRLMDDGEYSNESALIFTNRLSDLLFLFARKVK